MAEGQQQDVVSKELDAILEEAMQDGTLSASEGDSGADDNGNLPPGTFVATFSLDIAPSQRNRMDKIMRCCNNLINQMIADRKKALFEMEKTREWRGIQAKLKELAQQIAPLRRIKEEKRTEEQTRELARLCGLRSDCYRRLTEMKEQYGFTKYLFQSRMKHFRAHYANLIDSLTGQKLSDTVWARFSAYFKGKSDTVKFSPWKQFTSIEGKNNESGMIFKLVTDTVTVDGSRKTVIRGGYLQFKKTDTSKRKDPSHSRRYCRNHRKETDEERQQRLRKEAEERAAREAQRRKWYNSPIYKHHTHNRQVKPEEEKTETENKAKAKAKDKDKDKEHITPDKGMVIKVRTPRTKDLSWSPSAVYETECLMHKVKYCRIIRKPYRNGWRYFLQLVLEGTAPLKVDPKTGELLHPLGKGRVGIDPSTRTVAVVSKTRVLLCELAKGIKHTHHTIQRIQRAMDRSRRDTNPEMFDPKTGKIIPINRLPAHCVKDGKRLWKYSRRYWQMDWALRKEYRRLHDMRLQKHRELANQIIGLGNEFYWEKMNWSALARKAISDAAKAKQEAEKARKQEEQEKKRAERKSRKAKKQKKPGKKGASAETASTQAPEPVTSEPAAATSTPVPSSVTVSGKPKKKQRRRVRFGRSIEGKAPATFENCLKHAVIRGGGVFHYIQTAKCKASQYHHDLKANIKPSLSERFKVICGHEVQRDIYSAYLIQHVNSSLDGYLQDALEADFEAFLVLYQQEYDRLVALKAAGENLPSSMGI